MWSIFIDKLVLFSFSKSVLATGVMFTNLFNFRIFTNTWLFDWSVEPFIWQSRMREAHMEPHTVRSHGFTLARTHRHDWLILILLMALVVLLNLIHPFKRFVGKDMMDDLKYPLKDNTIPVWSVPVSFIIKIRKCSFTNYHQSEWFLW